MEIMKEQRLVYLSRRQTEVAQLKESLAQESFDFAQVVGHRLKGHGETFGFPYISSLGITMEEAARAKDMEKLRAIVKSLDESVEENIQLINKQ